MRRLALLSTTATVVVFQGCLGLAEVETTSDGGADASVDAKADAPSDGPEDAGSPPLQITTATLPPRPAGAPTPSNAGVMRWFAARRVFAGTLDPSTGQKDPNAWRKIGHDIDGECTTAQMSQDDTSATCKRPQGAAAESLADAEECRDNAYGRILSQGTQTLASNWELQFHADLLNGHETLLLRLSDLDPGADDPFVPGAVYMSAKHDTAPKWDGSDVFQVQAATVTGPSLSDPPVMAFPKGYLAGNVWVSGERSGTTGKFPVLLIQDLLLSSFKDPVLVAALSPAHDRVLGSAMSAVADSVVISNEWSPYLLKAVGCVQYVVDALMSQFLLPSLDLGSDPPTYQTPGDVCSALSIGAAYEWVPIKAPSEVVDTGGAFTPCDGG
jgi:hypothetical protein